MIYKLNSLEKDSVLNLFDFDYDEFFFYENLEREDFIKALCYFLSFFSNQKSIENIQSAYYSIQNSFGSGEEEQFLKNFIFINKILIDKYNFSFLRIILKDLDTISKFEVDREEYIIYTCEECNGKGEVFCNKEQNSMHICMECGGSGNVELYNPNYDMLSNRDIDKIKHIEFNFKKNIKNIINTVVQIILEEELHPDIGEVYKPYKTINNVKNF